MGVRRPLLLTDETLTRLGLAAKLLSLTGLSGCEICDQVPPDSSVDAVNRIAKLYRERGCDGVVALGGGSVLDTAKGVKLLIGQGADDILALMGCENLPRGARACRSSPCRPPPAPEASARPWPSSAIRAGASSWSTSPRT